MSKYRVAIVAARYNQSITDRLITGAQQTLQTAGLRPEFISLLRVPGAWELPLAVKWLVETGDHQAVIALGAVIKGETTHDEHLNRFVSLSLGEIGLQAGIPVAFGVLTCNNLQQAVERAGGRVGNKGEEAADAILEMLKLKNQMNANAT